MNQKYTDLLGEKTAQFLLEHVCQKVPAKQLTLPGSDFIDRVFSLSDRPIPVLRSLAQLYQHGALGGSGYLSIFPVDQRVEHSAGASFAKNPLYFDPQTIVEFALEGQCSAVASTLGGLGIVARRYAHKIPFIVKLNHNELLSYPNNYDQIYFGQVEQARDMGAIAVGATIYFGSPDSHRQIRETALAFQKAHELGMATVLWCYLRNSAFKQKKDFAASADLTGQANHLGVTLQADLIKQKLPTCNGGFTTLKFGKSDPAMYSDLASDHPIDLARYQVLNCYAGRIGLVNSGGESGSTDLIDAVKDAIINKRAGGTGMIIGRKLFQRSIKEGLQILKHVQEVYLDSTITIA